MATDNSADISRETEGALVSGVVGDVEDFILEDESFDFDPKSPDVPDIGIIDFRDQEGVTYPALLLSRVLFRDCLTVIKARAHKSYREVDTWIELPDGDGFQRIGVLQLDSDMLLTLRYLKIVATVYYDKETVEVLDLDNWELLERFL